LKEKNQLKIMQKPIKICYILPEYNEDTSSHFFHLYEFLEKLSHKADIFLIVENFKNGKIRVGNIVYAQKFKFLPLRFLESFFIVLKARMLGYKNFYTHYCYIGGINAAFISRLFGGKSYYWNCAMNWLFKQRGLSKIGYRISLKLSHFLVTGSEAMRRGYIEHYRLNPEKVKVMPNWINLNRFQNSRVAGSRPAGQNPELKTLLFVHWLSKRKGADTIIPIVKQLESFKSHVPKFKLLVVGDGPHKEQLLSGIKENNLKQFIEIIGGVSNKNITEYYAEADLFIMPSMEEGFPRVLLEAMAFGIPYVASDVGAVREISPETAQRFLVKSGEVERFAQKIQILLSDSKIYNQFKKEELEKVKEYSLDRVLDKFLDLFV
jgi:glycosyltransferase involved in cell wall biosynthesis